LFIELVAVAMVKTEGENAQRQNSLARLGLLGLLVLAMQNQIGQVNRGIGQLLS
jgi:hypothetical protein